MKLLSVGGSLFRRLGAYLHGKRKEILLSLATTFILLVLVGGGMEIWFRVKRAQEYDRLTENL
ncbi:MAG: hypothetical protein H6581_18065 [Bacteroidia bacterium]|nr:hypothetical protein [Bacteroidia bacterium]